MRARLALAALAVTGLGATGAAAGRIAAAPERPSLGSVEVELAEWRIDAGTRPVRAGRVTFEETNTGREEHDLLIVRTDLPADRLPAGLEGVDADLAGDVVLGAAHRGHADHGGAGHDHVRSGDSRERTVTLKPGRYVLICPIPGHYERGQRAVITVR